MMKTETFESLYFVLQKTIDETFQLIGVREHVVRLKSRIEILVPLGVDIEAFCSTFRNLWGGPTAGCLSVQDDEHCGGKVVVLDDRNLRETWLAGQNEPIVIMTSGGLVDLNNPPKGFFTIDMIAQGLSRINRFCGQTVNPSDVAMHSIAVAYATMCTTNSIEATLLGLMHDAHEAFVGDMLGPIKRHMPEFERLAVKVQSAIASDLDLPKDGKHRLEDELFSGTCTTSHVIRKLDELVVLGWEVDSLFNGKTWPYQLLPDYSRVPFRWPVPCDANSHAMFISLYLHLIDVAKKNDIAALRQWFSDAYQHCPTRDI